MGAQSESAYLNAAAMTTAKTKMVVARSARSMCSAELNGKRCEIQCRSPRVAQCGKDTDVSEPSCFCQSQ